ncbi:hypothetical protein CEXT_798561 [Caerostris extrusa]|uniref:Uncharacterized protein n=1 Tax=Caerostris extrusa TaxID=172846 RepID=A0AAV4Q4Q6_CAEEX|nr:hypothetical protein CEXT_798561 [Caerostris extrusa]
MDFCTGNRVSVLHGLEASDRFSADVWLKKSFSFRISANSMLYRCHFPASTDMDAFNWAYMVKFLKPSFCSSEARRAIQQSATAK